MILFGLHDFLNKHVGVAEDYTDTEINKNPQKNWKLLIKKSDKNLMPSWMTSILKSRAP